MKILVVGDGHSKIHEVAVTEAFLKLGHQVETFYWHKYFGSHGPVMKIWLRIQNKFIWGPAIKKINQDLLKKACQLKPEVIFVYRGTHITRETIMRIKALIPHGKVFGYNNDDPFARGHPFWLWRNFIDSLPHYDLMLAYRHHNIEDYRRAGARRVELLRSWFIPDVHHPTALSGEDKTRFACDVVFVGHYEPDQRVSFLEEIVHRGWQLNLFGPGWGPVIRRFARLASKAPIQVVLGEDYNRALCGASIALSFLSKLNRDTYTRRCFEIPATGTLMLSEYSSDLAGLFREGQEAEFFRTKEEMIEKIEQYLNDASRRSNVAKAGYHRVYKDGHDVISRMKQVLVWYDQIMKESA